MGSIFRWVRMYTDLQKVTHSKKCSRVGTKEYDCRVMKLLFVCLCTLAFCLTGCYGYLSVRNSHIRRIIVCKDKIRHCASGETILNDDVDDGNDNDEEFCSTPYFSALESAQNSFQNQYFFPGHRSGEQADYFLVLAFGKVFSLDLPELDETDNLHCPKGPLLKSLQIAAATFGAKRTWFLVNGSTGGIIASILAMASIHKRRRRRGAIGSASGTEQPSILVLARDSHKSAFDAISLAQIDAVLLPCITDHDFGVSLGPRPEDVLAALDRFGDAVCGVLLTRPTYQGVGLNTMRCSQLVKECHTRGVPVLVDEAHGAHLRFLDSPDMQDAMSCGADICVQSTHKTLTSLSQTAMLHMGHDAFRHSGTQEELLPEDESEAAAQQIQRFVSALTTTSPNSVLLATLDVTRQQFGCGGWGLVNRAADAANELRQKTRQQTAEGGRLHLLDDAETLFFGRTTPNDESESEGRKQQKVGDLVVDPLRLTVRFEGSRAVDVDEDMCNSYDRIYCELNLEKCVTYAIGPLSTSETLQPLQEALLAQGEIKAPSRVETQIARDGTEPAPFAVCSESLPLVRGRLAAEGFGEVPVPLLSSLGRIAAETICAYPPGIPVVVRGEVVGQDALRGLVDLARNLKPETGSEASKDAEGGGLGSGRSVVGCSDPTLTTITVFDTAEQ